MKIAIFADVSDDFFRELDFIFCDVEEPYLPKQKIGEGFGFDRAAPRS